MFLKDPAAHPTYFNYIIGKEFDNLLSFTFPNISMDSDGNYGFTADHFKLNQMKERENVSYFESMTKMVKMHLFNMPILRKTDSGFKVIGRADKRAIAKITKLIRDNNITDIDTARDFFKDRTTDEVMQSFYHRFLSEEAIEITDKNGVKVSYNSMSSPNILSTQAGNETITSILMFVASSKENQYNNVDFSEDGLTAQFTNIDRNLFRNNLEMAVKGVSENTPFESLGDNKMRITYPKREGGRNVNKTWTLENKNGFTKLVDGNPKDINIILSKLFHFAPTNIELTQDVLDITQLNSKAKLTMSVVYNISKWLETEQGSRDAALFSGIALLDWVTWSDKFQSLKNVESSFGYNNINGDKVELLTTGAPVVFINQKVKDIASINRARMEKGNAPTVFVNNAFVKEETGIGTEFDQLRIRNFQLKEGFKAKRNSKANSKLFESEQMAYDFKHLFIGSLLKSCF